MPGPGRVKNPKPKRKIAPLDSSSPIRDPYLNRIDDAGQWRHIVNILCDVFDLPGKYFVLFPLLSTLISSQI